MDEIMGAIRKRNFYRLAIISSYLLLYPSLVGSDIARAQSELQFCHLLDPDIRGECKGIGAPSKLPPCPTDENQVYDNCFGNWSNGSLGYLGEWKNNLAHGRGTLVDRFNNRYSGTFNLGRRNGSLIVLYGMGDNYEGEYKSDRRNGHGVYSWKDGSKYIGEWKDGEPTGAGKFTDSSGRVLTGIKYKSRGTYQDGNMTYPDILLYIEPNVEPAVQQTLSEPQQTASTSTAETQPKQQEPVAANENTRRLALVVGVDDYQNVTQLKKAVNDSRAVSTALQKIGYDVVSVENPDRRTMSTKLQEFQGKIQPGDTAFFFFAGHGVALGPDNILLAADVPKLEPGQDDIAKDEGFSVDNIIRRFQKQGAKTTMLVLDACRNNPFESDGTRSVGNTRGLAKQDAPEGVFVLFSAGLGQEALDRLSDDDPNPNSVFTRELIPALMTPSITHNILAKRVQKDVSELAATINVKQQPAYYDQVVGEIPMNSLK